MSAPKPKSILKKPTASFPPAGPSQSHPHYAASKPRVGSKLKHTVALRAEDKPSKSRDMGKKKPKAPITDHGDEDQDQDEDMSAQDDESDGNVDDDEDDVSTGDEIERAKDKAGRKKAPTSESGGGGGLHRRTVTPSHLPCTVLCE
jgi:hypothetical protein